MCRQSRDALQPLERRVDLRSTEPLPLRRGSLQAGQHALSKADTSVNRRSYLRANSGRIHRKRAELSRRASNSSLRPGHCEYLGLRIFSQDVREPL
jgi:hypothetical protein